MSKDNWITIAGTVAQIIIGITAIVVMWYIGRRQIQIMLAQTNPNVKIQKKPLMPYLMMYLTVFGIFCASVAIILHFIFTPLATRFQSLTLLINAWGIAGNYALFRKIRRLLARISEA